MKLEETKKLRDGLSGVYLIVCKDSGIKYIGSSKDVKKRAGLHLRHLEMNVHSNPALQSAFNEYGRDSLSWKLLEEFVGDHHILKQKEKEWYFKFKDSGSKIANVIVPEDGTSGMTFERSDEFKKQMSILAKERIKKNGLPDGFGGQAKTFLGHHHTEETRQKISEKHLGEKNGMYGKHLSDEARAKIREANQGKVRSTETRNKISSSKKGKPNGHEGMVYDEDWRKNISNSLKGKSTWAKGKKFSEEHKRKIAEANRGKKLSDEARAKIREARAKQKMPKWTEERRQKFKQTWERKHEQDKN